MIVASDLIVNIVLGLGLFVLLAIILSSFFTVQTAETAIITRFGR